MKPNIRLAMHCGMSIYLCWSVYHNPANIVLNMFAMAAVGSMLTANLFELAGYKRPGK